MATGYVMLCTNWNIPCSICTKLHMFGKSPYLKTSKGQYSVIIIVPPAGNRKLLLYTNLYRQCPICTKFHMFGKSPGLKTSTCQCSVIGIAPPAGSRKFGTYKWLWHIPPIFTILRSYCPPFAVFLKPPVSGEPGCEVPFIAACSFN